MKIERNDKKVVAFNDIPIGSFLNMRIAFI